MSINYDNEDESNENTINLNNDFFYSLLRDQDYINTLYITKESITYSKNIEKIYGYTKERNLNIIITKIIDISFKSNQALQKRLITITKLIENNLLLLENLWLEESEKSDIYSLYISEYTKSIYKNEYNLITINNYLNEKQNEKYYKENISLLLQILKKLNELHNKYKFAHLNLNPNNIYINKINKNIYFGPAKFLQLGINSIDEGGNYSNLWYSSPENCYIEKYIEEDLKSGIYNDIWSIGCIICEMFFIVLPLFQTFSKREKMKKIIEVLGIPQMDDIDYMSHQEYSFIQSTEENNFSNSNNNNSYNSNSQNKLSEFLFNNQEDFNHSSINYTIKKILFEIIYKCLLYNRKKRITINEIINQIDYIFNRFYNEKPMKIETMNIINRDNLMQLNVPLTPGQINSINNNKNYNNINTMMTATISNNENNKYNSNGSYLIPFSDSNNKIGDRDSDIDLNLSMNKNYNSFMSAKTMRCSTGNPNVNTEIDEKINQKNSGRNFTKFCSISSISSNKNYNKAYINSFNNNNNNANLTTNYNNMSGKFTENNNSVINDQHYYSPTDIEKRIKKNDNAEYEKLHSSKFILFL